MRVRASLVMLLLLFGAGCPELESGSVPARCARAYEKCKLPSGPLGVCDRRACKDGETEPCLVCVPQH